MNLWLSNVCIIQPFLGHSNHAFWLNLLQRANPLLYLFSNSWFITSVSLFFAVSLLPFITFIDQFVSCRDAAEWIKHKLGVRQDELDLWFGHLLSTWPWGYGLPSLSGNPYICKIGLIISISQIRIKWDGVCKVFVSALKSD